MLEQLVQYPTYVGLTAGLPSVGLNKEIIQEALDAAPRKLGRTGRPHLIEPPQQEIPLSPERREKYDYQPVRLPAVTCLGEFVSYQVARDANHDASSLMIVWYQEEPAFPMDTGAEEQIRAVDWKTLASDFSW